MGFRILRDNRTDDRKAIWLNETAMQAMELPDSASYCEYFKCPIAGIVQDFRYRDLTHPAEPCIIEHMQDNYWPWACIIQLTNLDSPVTLRTIERVYREYTGGMPCEYKTYDEVMHQQYAAQQRMSDIPVSYTHLDVYKRQVLRQPAYALISSSMAERLYGTEPALDKRCV